MNTGNILPRIIIVGGGAGGLELAARLGRKLGRRQKAHITLIDANPTHIWKPLLHEVATGALDQSLDEVTYAAHARTHGYHFQLGRLTQLNRDNQSIQLAPVTDANGDEILGERHLPYEYLVIATGSVSNDFGTPGVADHCHFLDSAKQAEVLRTSLLNTFLRYSGDDTRASTTMSVAIVGAGATGVELSAELLSASELLASYGYTRIGPEQLQVHLIEASPQILPALPDRISQAVNYQLEQLGVQLHTNTLITEANGKGFVTKSGEHIDADLCVWAAGVKGNAMLSELGLSTRPNHQILVTPSLQSVDDERIFAIGDCAACRLNDTHWVPPRAQSAHQMASHTANNLIALLKGKPVKPFHYRDFGSLISLARFSAVGSLMRGKSTGKGLFIEGMLAKFFYISLYRMHQRALHGNVKTLLKMIVDGINSMLRPRLKLH